MLSAAIRVNGIVASCLRIFFTSWRAAKPEPMITMPLLILPTMPVRKRHLCRESITGTGRYSELHSKALLTTRPTLSHLFQVSHSTDICFLACDYTGTLHEL